MRANKWTAMIVCVFGLGCAATNEAPILEEENGSIIGGEIDLGDPSVVAVYAQTPGSSSGFLCTGSVIAPSVVLTAAHCVSPSETGPDARFWVLTAPDLDRGGGSQLAVREVHGNALWSANDLEKGHDQGVVLLSKPTALKPLPINRAPLSPSLVGKSVRIVGYGLSDGIEQTGSGVKRQALTALRTIGSKLIRIGDSRRGTCNGDSGGPAFMSLAGVETIVGTTSYGNAECTDGGYDARIDSDLAFIDKYLPHDCQPACDGKACGGDGCGGVCGICGAGDVCRDGGICVAPVEKCANGAATEQEPNDSALQPNVLCDDGRSKGELSSALDQDWFTWTVRADSIYQVALSAASSAVSLRVYKLGTTGRLAFIGDGPVVSRHTVDGGTYVGRIIGGSDAPAAYALNVSDTL